MPIGVNALSYLIVLVVVLVLEETYQEKIEDEDEGRGRYMEHVSEFVNEFTKFWPLPSVLSMLSAFEPPVRRFGP